MIIVTIITMLKTHLAVTKLRKLVSIMLNDYNFIYKYVQIVESYKNSEQIGVSRQHICMEKLSFKFIKQRVV